MWPYLEWARKPVPLNDDDLPIPVPPVKGLQMSDECVFPGVINTHVEEHKGDIDFIIENQNQPQDSFQEKLLNDLVLDVSLVNDRPEG